MRIEVAPGVWLFLREAGTGARTVLLVHGWMMSGAVFDPLVRALDGAGLRLLVPDLRGAGRSDAPGGYAITDYVADLVGLLDALGIDRVAVVGHSMGGQVAQLLAADHPERVERLVLLAPVPAGGLALPDDALALFRASAGDRALQGTILDLACRALDPAERERLLDVAGTVAPEAITGSLDAWVRGGFASRLPRVTAPTTVIATSDPFLPPALLQAEIVDRLRGARLRVLEGPGHYPQVEATARTAALLADLLAE